MVCVKILILRANFLKKMEKMYQETLETLSSLLTVAVREKDEASERLQSLLAEIAKLEELFNSFLLSQEQQGSRYYHLEALEETYRLQNCDYNHFSGEFPLPLDLVSNPSSDHSSPVISESGSYNSSSNQMGFDVQNRRDFETIVLEKIRGVLPENGKFVQAVTDAGQLLESLLITGPVPKWRNPPVQVSSQRPIMNNNFGDLITGNWNYVGVELGSGMLNRYFTCKRARFS